MARPLPTVLACGAWLKNAACLLSPGATQWSAVHGDLSDPQACRALDQSARALLQAAPQPVAALAHDRHPDFYSTRLAVALAHELGVPAIGVQHHHAHIAAVMAEYDVAEPVIGLALDGVGLGTDGQAWGGELLWVAPQSWQRLGHLYPLALPGGDVAAREPWRMAAAALHALGRTDEVGPRFTPVVGKTAADMVQRMLARSLNCPTTSSTGRWFDAAAGALGLSVRQAHEAEAAMALEQLAQTWLLQHAPPAIDHGLDLSDPRQLDLRPLLAQPRLPPRVHVGQRTGVDSRGPIERRRVCFAKRGRLPDARRNPRPGSRAGCRAGASRYLHTATPSAALAAPVPVAPKKRAPR